MSNLLRNAVILFFAEALSYGLIALGFIAIAEYNGPVAFFLDVFTYIVGFFVLKTLLEVQSKRLVFIAAVGGGSGTFVAIQIGKVLFA